PLMRSAAALGVRAWRQNQSVPASDEAGYRLSDVIMVARDSAALAPVLDSGLWLEMQSDGGPIWTDDRANPLSILKAGALKQ
ncbi:MAG: transporter, partial [Pseudomonadota bacterium]